MVQARRFLRPRVLALTAALVAAGVAAFQHWGDTGGPAAPPALPVTVAVPVQRQVTDWAEYTGQFSAVEAVELRARVSGAVTDIAFTDGQMVNKGDLLFVVDPRPYEIALASARAKLAQAGSSREFAKRQLNRAGELRQKDFVSQSVLDQREQESRGAGAGAEAARAAVRQAELDLEFTRVIAPIAGRVGAHLVDVGNLISAGGAATLLTTIVALDPIHFDFDMSEADYYRLQQAAGGKAGPGLPVMVRIGDEQGWPHAGKLDFIDNHIDRGTGTIRARAVLDNPDHTILPGTFGHVRLAASLPFDALLVPDAAIVTDQASKVVMTVTPDGTVVPKPVQPGQMDGGLRVVRSGLAPDDRVVVNGLMRARPGSKVAAQDGAIEAPQGGH